MKLTTLATRFLRVGLTGFGGPMALLGLMQQEVVEKSDELTQDDLADGVVLGQILPGPVAVDCATHLGYRVRGLAGAAVSTTALIFPSFLLMLIIAPLYLRHGRVPQVSAFFLGVAPAVIAVLVFAGWRLGKQFVTGWGSAAIAVVVAVAALLKAPPILLILLSGLMGLSLGRLRSQETAKP